MKKILIIALPLLMAVVSCKKDLSSLNVDTKNPTQVPASSLFSSAQKNLVDLVTNSNVNINIFRIISQYWTETTYTDEANYDLGTRGIPENFWARMYRDALMNFNETKKVVNANEKDPGLKANQLALADIMEIYGFYYLVTTYGNIPYSEALDPNNLFPKYEDQKTIYYDLLTRLDADIAALNPAVGSFGSADLLYGGDVAKWVKFANSFKLKMGITIADYDNAKAQSVVESAVQGGVFTSNADNAMFAYVASPPNTNPIWIDLVQSGRKDFVGTSTIIDMMKNLNDPRLPLYFTTDANGGYSGGIPGKGNSYSAFSKPSETITAPDFPADLLDYSEVEFDLAEAAQRGYNVGGTASQHYNNAVTASIEFWGGTDAQAAAYLDQPSVTYNPANWKTLIGEQKYIALYNRGIDAWIEIRRLDTPTLPDPINALSPFPVRFTYPVNEQNLNTANYKSASAAIGGDEVTTKLFWDKF
jgi:hypothetical protein